MFESPDFSILKPPAIVREAFDEQALKREWDAACADERDARERKAAVLQAALEQWPMVLSSHPPLRAQGKMVHSPEMRRFVRDVLGMPDTLIGGMNGNACMLLSRGVEGKRADERKNNAYKSLAFKLRRAVIELTTKYRLGADPAECMEALAKFYEEQTNVKA